MPDGVQAIVLCEDLQGWVFARRMLLAMGYENGRIRLSRYKYPAKGGGGSGEQHVRERYPDELRAYRPRAARTKTTLVVLTDADKLTVPQRRKTLEDALEKKALAPRGPEERVALLVPKWEIETWIHFFLDGTTVDEDRKDYPKYEDHEADAAPAAETFGQHARQATTPAQAPPSLVTGLIEARRAL
ncbi:hypothetical protein [Polyangium sorediatum]|uniref:DUF4276 family protein n=1 Tax=Polyangium sorediatum TaxID=889274 RepID=A0ABT6NKI2_9BACT|nr:hypothetical protein [Polyangium sorediatum]MDI1428814.1 hypothetical protein [Polyangium sorediatum]